MALGQVLHPEVSAQEHPSYSSASASDLASAPATGSARPTSVLPRRWAQVGMSTYLPMEALGNVPEGICEEGGPVIHVRSCLRRSRATKGRAPARSAFLYGTYVRYLGCAGSVTPLPSSAQGAVTDPI